MKKLIATILLFGIFSISYGQLKTSELSIHYGFLGTTYYSNGKLVTKKAFKSDMSRNKIALSKFKDGRTRMTLGNIIYVPSFAILWTSIEGSLNGNTPYRWQWYTGIGGSIFGMLLYYSGKNKTMEAVQIFNRGENASFSLNTRSGLGLTYRF